MAIWQHLHQEHGSASGSDASQSTHHYDSAIAPGKARAGEGRHRRVWESVGLEPLRETTCPSAPYPITPLMCLVSMSLVPNLARLTGLSNPAPAVVPTLAAGLLALGLSGCASSSRPAAGAGPASSPAGAGPDSSASPAQSSDTTGESQKTAEANPAASSTLPDFELDTLQGDSVRLSDHLGRKVILLDFWATFCDPCLVAMPHLNDLYEKYGDDGFVILGVSIDGPQSVARVRSEVRKLGVEFPILLDQETEVLAMYNPKTSAPYSLLIGKDGHVLKKKEGFTPTDVPALEAAIQDALRD